jgi:2-methylisocitrate lyase-like PEP mutase family enzyme
MKKTTVLKRMIENNEFFVLPGGGCALHAKVAEAVGFKVAYMSGMNACATVFGVPDAGLLTLTEMVENAGRMANAVNIRRRRPGLRQRHQRPPHGAGVYPRRRRGHTY